PVATCLGAGIMSIAMGLISNTPFALASGMGINAVVTFTIILGLGLSWQQAMGIIVIEGILVLIMVLTKLRIILMNAIPMELKYAIGVGIGLFIAFIGAQEAGFVAIDPVTAVRLGDFYAIGVGIGLFIAFIGAQEAGFVAIDPVTAVRLGDFTANYTLLAAFGLVLTIILVAFKVRGAILIGIAGTTAAGMIFRIIPLPARVVSVPTAGSFSTFFKADIFGAVWSNGMINIAAIIMIFALFMTDFFDTMGTVIGVGEEAGLLDKNGNLQSLRRVLLIDSGAAVAGGLFGCSSITTYIESASGVSEGGRTGIMPTTTGALFILSIFFAPLIAVVGGGVQTPEGVYKYPVTAPALIVVGFLMMGVISKINFKDFEVGIPAFLTIIIMPFTYNISYGIGFGFISYTLIKLFRRKAGQLHPLMIVASALFIVAFIAQFLAEKFMK
ncbi:MAG: NCS2 family permease, partial [Actinobacteria bacterium]|nr:NCS2 family permease [Actinomycetota bacterium]